MPGPIDNMERERLDWQDNHELRIVEMEKWREKHESYTFAKVERMATLESAIKPIEQLGGAIERLRERQDMMVKEISAKIDKILFLALSSLIAFVAQLIISLIKK